MQVIHERCCGLDIHKKSVVACLLTPQGKQTRTFGTTTKEIKQLLAWLQETHCTHVAMESTGVYWKPLYNVLEGQGLDLLVVNAYQMRSVPGRKTDVKDAEWIADLLRHGLLQASFIPDRAQRELQELIRYRKSLIEERGREVQRIQKVLEGANIKLAAVVTDVVGVSGRAILEAVIAGVGDAEQLAGLAKGRLQSKRGELEEALHGVVGAHQRTLLAVQLRHIAFLDAEIARLDAEVEERLRPWTAELDRLDTIPGVGRRGAETILAAIGPDVSRFPTHRHLASWAKLCPGLKESGGKRLRSSVGKGNASLRHVLIEAAWGAARTRNTYLSAQYHRLAARRGNKRAAMAVAHSILVIVYHVLKDGSSYQDLGPNYFDERAREMTVRRAVQRLERLGVKVTIEDAA
jgi:transposase